MSAEAETKVWTGSTNTAWAQGNNWNPTGVPGSTDVVYIPDVSNDPVVQADATVKMVQINDSAVLTIDGATFNVTNRIIIKSDVADGSLELSNDLNGVNVESIYNYGSILVNSGRTPMVNLSHLYSYSGSTIKSGFSTFTFVGAGNNTAYMDVIDPLYNVIIDAPTATLMMNGTYGLDADGQFRIIDGKLDPTGKEMVVSYLYCYDEIEMETGDWLHVTGDANFYNGSYLHGDNGTLTIDDDLYIGRGSTIELEGSHHFNITEFHWGSNLNLHEDSAQFNDVTIDKGYGHVALNTNMTINGTLTVSRGVFKVIDVDSLSVRYLVVHSNGHVQQSRDSNVTVTEDVSLYSGSRYELGNGTNDWHGGSLAIGRDIDISGRLWLFGRGGEIVLTRHMRIYGSGNLTFYGGNLTTVGPSSGAYTYGGSDTYIHSSNTTITFDTYTHYAGCRWWVNRSASPTIVFKSYIYNAGTVTAYTPGLSTIVAYGNYVASNLDSDIPVRNLVINKTSGHFKPSYGPGTLNISGSLLLIDGELDIRGEEGYNIVVNGSDGIMHEGQMYRGFANIGGELLMETWNDSLEVSGGVYWGPDSEATVDTGWIHCRGNWTFAAGSSINLTGNNTVRFFGGMMGYSYQLWMNSSASSFCNVLHGMGMTSSFVNGTVPMVIDNNLTFTSLNAMFVEDGAELIVWGDANVTSILYVNEGGDVYIHGNLTVAGGPGRLDFGLNSTSDYGGSLHVNGWMSVWNPVNFYMDGGNLTVDGNATIHRTGYIMFKTHGGNMSAGNISINDGGALRIYTTNTTIDTAQLRSYGELNISNSVRPVLRISGRFNWLNGDFRLGRSEVRAVGTSDQRFEDSHPYWGLVIDKPSGNLTFEAPFPIVAQSYIGVAQGTLAVGGYTIQCEGEGSFGTDGYVIGVNRYPGFIMDGGVLDMNHTSGVLEVDRFLRWFDGTANGSSGTIITDASWTVYAGVDADIQCPVVMTSNDVYARTFTMHSSDFTFNDLIINTSTRMTQTSYSSHPIHVTGDLWINNTDNYDEFNITKGLVVDGDINIRIGSLVLSNGAEVTVGGDVEQLPARWNGWLRIYNGSMDIGGYYHCDGWGVDVSYHGGSMDITGPLWIDSQLPPAGPGFYVGQKPGYSFDLTAEFIRINATGYMNLSSDNTRIVSQADLINHGSLRSWGDAMPDIVTYDDIEGSGTFNLGHSSIWYEGDNAFQDVRDLPYWNLVINKTSGVARSQSDISVESCLFIMNGTYDMNGYKLWVNSSGNSFIWNGTHYSGFVNYGGILFYQTSDEELHVNGPVSWGPGVNQTFDMGTIYVNGSWEFMAGSQVNLTGTHLVYFWGRNWFGPYISWAPIYSNSTTSWFNDITIDRDFGFGQYTSEKSTETVVVKGDMDHDGGLFEIYASTMYVVGNVDNRGQSFYVEGTTVFGNASLTVDGDFYSQSGSSLNVFGSASYAWSRMTCSYLYVNGSLNLKSYSSVHAGENIWISGSIDYDQAGFQWAEVISDGNIYVSSPGNVDMSGIGRSHLNTTSGFIVVYNGATLDLRGNAQVTAWTHFHPYGTVICTGWWPEINVGNAWYSDTSGDFRPGWSQVTFFKAGTSYIKDTEDFADIILNKTSGLLYLYDGDLNCTDLDIESGTFDLNGYNLTVTDDLTVWGSLEMDHDGWINVTHEVNWMNGSTEDITNGTIQCDGLWYIEDGADMTFEYPVHVYLNASTDVIVDDPDSYFDNLTFRLMGGGLTAYINGTEALNATSVLKIDDKVTVRLIGGSIEATQLLLYYASELNVSSPDSTLHVWDYLYMDSFTELMLDNGSYAMVQDFFPAQDIYVMNGSNLTVVDDLIGGRILSRDGDVYIDDGASTSLNTKGRFHNLTFGGGASVYARMWIGGDLRILGGTVYPQDNDVGILGDYYCSKTAAFRPANGSRLVFNGTGRQFMETGGTDSNHELWDLIINHTTLIVQNGSLSVKNNITVMDLSMLWIKADNMTLYTGEDGLWNDGSFLFEGPKGKNSIVFYAGTNVTTDGYFVITGNPTYRTIVRSSSAGTQWNFNDSTPEQSLPSFDRIRVRDSDATSGDTIYADGTSVDAGNNDNWAFGKPLTLDLSGLEGQYANLTVEQQGLTTYVYLTDGITESWADSGTTATLVEEYSVSSTERYYTEDTTSWSMSGNVSASVTFYRQWKPTITLDGTDASHTVTAYYTVLGGNSSQSGQHTSWSRWVDNGSALSFDEFATGDPERHTGEDFDIPPWDPLTSALVYTLDYAENEVPELHNGNMDPASGNLSTLFNFTVEYWDSNDDAPLFVYVNIDGTNYTMNKTDRSDHDYTDGCEYHYETYLSGGDHDYYFIANDTYSTNQTAMESTGTVIPEFGPTVVIVSMMAVGVAVIWRRRRR